jgi:hypothetical protein
MNIEMKLTEYKTTQKTANSEDKTRTAVGIDHFLTQKIIRQQKIEKLMNHQVYGASFTMLKNSEVSNAMLTNTRRCLQTGQFPGEILCAK